MISVTSLYIQAVNISLPTSIFVYMTIIYNLHLDMGYHISISCCWRGHVSGSKVLRFI